MELNCSSCGRKHRTEDHPSAFEINCVCGYSILVPDENAIAASLVNEAELSPTSPASMSAAPLSMDAQDESLAIPLQQTQVNITNTTLPTSINEQLTPPNQLPSEMPYDPYELAQLEQNKNEATISNAFADPSAAEISQSTFQPSELANPEASASTAARSSTITQSASDFSAPLKGQTLVERSLAASVGQLLGANYNIQIEKLAAAQRKELSETCRQLLAKRPWLEAELRKRNFEVAQLESQSEFANLPEIIALEIYLKSIQLGGNCHYEKLS